VLLLLQTESTVPAQEVRLTEGQMQQLSDMASQGAHDQLLMLGFCVLLLSAIAMMQAIAR